MRIDSHQHFWNYSPEAHAWIDDSMAALKRDFLPEHLKAELEKEGFEGSVAVQASQTLEETQWLLGLAEKFSYIKGVVGWVDLRSPEARRQLQKFASRSKFKGVRHVAQSEPDDRFLVGKDFLEGIKALEEFHLTYDILVFPRQLPAAIELARRFPRQPFVLDHIAKPEIKAGKMSPWRENIRELAQNPNVYCKLSGMVTEADWKGWKPEDFKPYLDVIFEAFGPKRLLFGSDWPVCLLAGNYASVKKIAEDYLAGFSREDREAIMGGNAERFYKLLRERISPGLRLSPFFPPASPTFFTPKSVIQRNPSWKASVTRSNFPPARLVADNPPSTAANGRNPGRWPTTG